MYLPFPGKYPPMVEDILIYAIRIGGYSFGFDVGFYLLDFHMILVLQQGCHQRKTARSSYCLSLLSK